MSQAVASRPVSPVVLCVAVAVGCALGGLGRFETGGLIMDGLGGGDLLATGVVNVVGSFAMAVFATLTAPQGRYPMGETARQFVMAGFCGGFTTRSLLGLNTFLLILDDHWLFGAAYVVVVVLLSLAAAAAGYVIASGVGCVRGRMRGSGAGRL